MRSPYERAAEVSRLVQQVKEHPMCARFEQSARLYRVIYPTGFQLAGVRTRVGASKAEALRRLLDAMERHWNE